MGAPRWKPPAPIKPSPSPHSSPEMKVGVGGGGAHSLNAVNADNHRWNQFRWRRQFFGPSIVWSFESVAHYYELVRRWLGEYLSSSGVMVKVRNQLVASKNFEALKTFCNLSDFDIFSFYVKGKTEKSIKSFSNLRTAPLTSAIYFFVSLNERDDLNPLWFPPV